MNFAMVSFDGSCRAYPVDQVTDGTVVFTFECKDWTEADKIANRYNGLTEEGDQTMDRSMVEYLRNQLEKIAYMNVDGCDPQLEQACRIAQDTCEQSDAYDGNNCKQCGSCGVSGCCFPGSCPALLCKYGENYIDEYERMSKNLTHFYNLVQAIGIDSPYDLTIAQAKELSEECSTLASGINGLHVAEYDDE